MGREHTFNFCDTLSGILGTALVEIGKSSLSLHFATELLFLCKNLFLLLRALDQRLVELVLEILKAPLQVCVGLC